MQRCEWSFNYHQYGFSFGNVVWYRSDLHIILCAIYHCGYILLNVDINYTQLNIFSMCRRKRVKGNWISLAIPLANAVAKGTKHCCQSDRLKDNLGLWCAIVIENFKGLNSECIVVPMPCILTSNLWSMFHYLMIYCRFIFLSNESILISSNIIIVY